MQPFCPRGGFRNQNRSSFHSASVAIASFQQSSTIPAHAPGLPKLYDWLIVQLQRSLLTTRALFTPIEDERSGESLSVRFASWMLDLDRLPLPLPFGWELLEVSPYSSVYPNGESEDFLARAVAAKRLELTIDETSADPLPYKRCERCMSTDLHRDSVRLGDDEILYIYCAKCEWSALTTAR